MLPWLIFTVAVTLCLYAPFSYRAVNAAYLGKQDTGLALFFSFTFPMAIYASLSLSAILIALAPFYRKRSKRGMNILLFSAFVGVLPLAYIWDQDVARANAG